MPGRLFLTTPVSEVAAVVGADVGAIGDEPARCNIQPGQEVLAIVAGPALTRMRWGLIPQGRVNARGRPVLETLVNARSETVFSKSAFAGVGRCVVPADGWYEWTGSSGRKTAWRIRAATGGLLFFAGVCDRWDAPGGREVWQLATVTCPPNLDVRDIHDRMGALLSAENIPVWLDGDEEAAGALMVPVVPGTLVVEKAEGVDWQAP